MAAAIAEELGAKDLQKLKGSDLDAYYDRLSRRGLSATSVRRYHAVCSAALNQEVRWGLLERSPATQASPPSMERNEPDAPTPDEIKLLIERAEEKDPEPGHPALRRGHDRLPARRALRSAVVGR